MAWCTSLAWRLAASAVFTAAVFPAAAFLPASAAPDVACGGVGADARASLAEENARANLSLEFFVAGRGNYVADVDVTLTPLGAAAAGAPPVHVTTGGPICYLTLPPGAYRVQASLHGAERSARTTLPRPGAGTAHLALGFPATAVDGDLETRASPDEKQQARTP
jgi:hypothetical protein